jgi:hypothetical protein
MRVARLLAAALAVAVGVSLFSAVATSSASFSAHNGAWDGGSRLDAELRAVGVDPVVLTESAEYDALAPGDTVAVVLSPDSAYADPDAARVAAFVRAGGTLVVADDVGPHANDLLAAVGATARLDGRLLRDDQYHYRSPEFPVVTVNASVLPGAEAATLNRGTAVAPGGAAVAATTSRYAYLDANLNGELDDGESLGPYAVATVERVGGGRVVVLGDPSVFINAMLDRPGNRALLSAVVGDARTAAVDVSHRTGTPPLVTALRLVRESPPLGAALGVAAVLAVAAAAGLFAPLARRLSPAGRRRGATGRATRRAGTDVDVAAVAARLGDRNPDWDAARARRVATALARPDVDDVDVDAGSVRGR